MKKIILKLGLLTALAGGLVACTQEQTDEEVLKIGASIPYSDILEYAKEPLANKGVQIEVIEITDYLTPNLALADGSLDVNYFQHEPFFEESKATNGLDLVSLGKFYFGPLAGYSDKHKALEDLPDNGEVIIPNDPSNEARALILMDEYGLISLDDPKNIKATDKNIVDNPKNLKITPIEAAAIPRLLNDCDLALINFNFALDYGLSPREDGLIIENEESIYANLVAVRAREEDREEFKILTQVLASEEVADFVEKEFDGALININK